MYPVDQESFDGPTVFLESKSFSQDSISSKELTFVVLDTDNMEMEFTLDTIVMENALRINNSFLVDNPIINRTVFSISLASDTSKKTMYILVKSTDNKNMVLQVDIEVVEPELEPQEHSDEEEFSPSLRHRRRTLFPTSRTTCDSMNKTLALYDSYTEEIFFTVVMDTKVEEPLVLEKPVVFTQWRSPSCYQVINSDLQVSPEMYLIRSYQPCPSQRPVVIKNNICYKSPQDISFIVPFTNNKDMIVMLETIVLNKKKLQDNEPMLTPNLSLITRDVVAFPIFLTSDEPVQTTFIIFKSKSKTYLLHVDTRVSFQKLDVRFRLINACGLLSRSSPFSLLPTCHDSEDNTIIKYNYFTDEINLVLAVEEEEDNEEPLEVNE